MQIFARITLYSHKIDKSLYQQISQIYPEKAKPAFFQIQTLTKQFGIFPEDERFAVAYKLLEQTGQKPDLWDRNLDYTYRLELRKVYSAKECQQAAYLVPVPKVHQEMGWRDNKVHLGFDRYNKFVKLKPIFGASLTTVIVSEPVRNMMKEADFSHFVFRDVVWDEFPNVAVPYWELTSDLRLPPLSASHITWQDEVKRNTEDPDTPCRLFEGAELPEVLFSNHNLYYPAGVLENLEPFDAALTQEAIYLNEKRYLVVSQRFYQFCVQNKLKIDWFPVFSTAK